MSEAIAIQPKNDKEYALRQCLGRLFRNSWQIEAAASMIRNITESGMESREDTEVVLCNGLLAANSLLMTGLDELQDLLDLPNPDWNEIKKNQPGGMDIVSAIENAEKIAEGQKDLLRNHSGSGMALVAIILVNNDEPVLQRKPNPYCVS